MDLYQFLKLKTVETNEIISYLSKFLAIEDSDIKQDNKKNKESIVLEKKGNY
jgi:hypothetical protein